MLHTNVCISLRPRDEEEHEAGADASSLAPWVGAGNPPPRILVSRCRRSVKRRAAPPERRRAAPLEGACFTNYGGRGGGGGGLLFSI